MPLAKIIVGRVARDKIVNPITEELIVDENQVITEAAAKKIEDLGLESVRVRSVLTCESPLGVCAKCYGNDMSTGKLVEEGLAVGIIGRAVDRRAGHAVDDAHVPHRRRADR